MKNFFFSTKTLSNDMALLLLRIFFGGIMLINHGIGKIKRLDDEPLKFMDFMGMGSHVSLWLVVFAEAVCALLIIIGIATRFAVIPVIITMLVAIFVANAGEPLAEIELPVLYLIAFIVLLITGPGKYAVDSVIGSFRK